MRQSILALVIIVLAAGTGLAQELQATVTISTPKLQTTDPAVFKTMEQAILDFFNNQKWTEDVFESDERIECDFRINIIEELSDNTFKADIALQALRPVYGTDYKTALLSHVDKDVLIVYEQFQPMEDSRDNFHDNLSSVLTFYAYLILGYDYDTFSSLGGDNYFRIAQGIINTVPPRISDQDKGWTSLSNKNNRYWVIESLLSPRVKPYREAMYTYHRHGLDMMHTDIPAGQSAMVEALNAVDQVRNSYPNSMAQRMFTNAKSEEIIEIFKGADRQAKTRVMQIMRKVDVSNANKYNALRS